MTSVSWGRFQRKQKSRLRGSRERFFLPPSLYPLLYIFLPVQELFRLVYYLQSSHFHFNFQDDQNERNCKQAYSGGVSLDL